MKLTKIDKNISVLICVPCRDTMHSLFSYSLCQLVQYCNAVNIKINVMFQSGSLIAEQRHKLATNAIDGNYSHILWLDSDMLFPSYVLERLLSLNLPVVACNYSTRTGTIKNVAYEEFGNWNSWVKNSNGGLNIISVDAIGMGCMLVSITVFNKMKAPFFEVQYDQSLKEWIGEDFYFCNKLKEQGYKIFIDKMLSTEIQHLGVIGYYTN